MILLRTLDNFIFCQKNQNAMLPRISHGTRALRSATATPLPSLSKASYTTSTGSLVRDNENASQSAHEESYWSKRAFLVASVATAAMYHANTSNQWKADEIVEEPVQDAPIPEQQGSDQEEPSESLLLTQILHKLAESQTTRSRATELIELEALLKSRY